MAHGVLLVLQARSALHVTFNITANKVPDSIDSKLFDDKVLYKLTTYLLS